ncbi:unnamed protein product [Penicillium nalgiovense]|nr:unnamed protein product [Penicillium nalgiovense]
MGFFLFFFFSPPPPPPQTLAIFPIFSRWLRGEILKSDVISPPTWTIRSHHGQ